VTNPRIDLEVSSRKGADFHATLPPPTRLTPRTSGEIMLFLPKTFSGMVQLKSRKGKFRFLPELAADMRMIKRSDKEVLFFVGDPTSAVLGAATPSQSAIDFCQLSSGSGRLIVGLSGLDKYERKAAGFWKSLFGRSQDYSQDAGQGF
jgi:hypothetical protein